METPKKGSLYFRKWQPSKSFLYSGKQILSVQAPKIKKICPKKNFLYFGKWNFLTLRFKNFLYFLKRKFFLYFRKWNPALSDLSLQNFPLKKFPKKPALKKFLIFSQMKAFLIFSQKKPPALSGLGPQKFTVKKFLIFS